MRSTSPADSTRSIEHYLGPASGRFFGAGFRRITHRLAELEIDHLDGHGRIRAQAGLSYPDDWSTKSTGSMRPHLSSIDGLVIAVQLAEAYLVHTYGLGLEQRRRMWLRAFDMRVASPQEDLARFAVQAIDGGCAGAAPGSRCDYVSTFQCLVGTIRVACAIEHDIASQTRGGGIYGLSAEILGDAGRRHYGEGYRQRTHRIADVASATDGRRVRATIAVSDSQNGPDDGLAGAYGPSVSAVDCIVALAQLAQVLAYDIDGIEREASNTFWMRRLAMSSGTPLHPLDTCFDAVVDATSSRLLKIGPGFWRVLELSGHLGAIQAQSSAAHALPDAPSSLCAAA